MVSVVIPLFNGEKYIAEAINSVLKQTYSEIEVIVVDDGSTDKSPDIVKSFKKVNYIYQDNAGPSSARNTGMAASHGEYIAFLDCDDIYAENKIAEQVSILEKHKDADIVYNDCIAADKNLNQINTLRSEGIYENDKDFLCMLLFRQIIPIPSSIMIRRRCFEEGCLYNEGYKHAEDYEYIIRLAQRYKFRYIPKPLYIYRRHEGNLTNAHSLQQEKEIEVIRKLGHERIKEIVEGSSFSSAEKSFLLAKIYIKLSEYKPAENILLQLSETCCSNPLIWFYLGNCSYFLKKQDKAAEYYRKAISHDSCLSEAYNNLACTCAASDKGKALELLNKALSLRPDYMDAAHNLIQIKSGQANYKFTIRELRKTLINYMSI
ncbi:MAG TPA: glycosyltransferase [Bacillota bacterium]|nr:glycosyltransferase [Bacillota bacterium]HQJ36378.1 glycosyltransferase [Bacillota bacterium]